jgi:dihydrofolate reductase
MVIETADRPNLTSGGGSATRVILVAAVAANGIIGAGNRMPWHLPEDLRHFKMLTLGHPVIMGRKTFESILAMLGKPLPGRENIVVSRTPGLEIEGVSIASSIEGALAFCIGEPVAFVIGGGEIYKASLSLADAIVMTEIRKDFAGDTKFPDYDRGAFRETQRISHVSATGLPFDFVYYERVGSAASG